MPKVRFKSSKIQATLNKDIASRVLLDLGSARSTKPLNNKYKKHLDEVTNKLIKEATQKVGMLARAQYKESLDDVGDALSTGIRASAAGGTLQPRKRFKGIALQDWKALSHKYYKYKKRLYSSTASSFWKRSGKTYAAYRLFSAAYKSGVARSDDRIKLLNIKIKPKRRIYRFRSEFKIPSPTKGGQFFDAIFLKSFFQQKEFKLAGQPAGGGLDVIGYLEGVSTSPSYRPFISRLMAHRGKRFNKDLVKMLNQFTARNTPK